ncbi:MAG: M28 family peptidase [Sphingomonas sp.]|uniref:M28 family metallopeptidase n=1 Tax=Sphingomonas sp. TaxID=28214 RepID=UPI0025CEB02F|nr:M28 family peptidase [Sphingomonas sp.]MBX3562965.1 M28 family peptidase [Sphingomonas sp.]
MPKSRLLATACAAMLCATPAFAQHVSPEWVRAHENFLASPAMQGRGSGTAYELLAATYVAAQFEGIGLKRAPGMTGYLQSGEVESKRLKKTITTVNAIGFLPGTDPKAGVILISAHHDHLGIVNGKLMPGANDDASGAVAVIEIARALAAGKRMKRGILFVTYGAEELGGLGSTRFGEHSPVPLTSIVANIEIEMIGAPDPKLPAGHLMMTGFERSNLGETLRKHGALVTQDPYPEQHFFERSDNYSLALQGVVAHTISGWATTPNYHSENDTVANLDIGFMTRAIQSLIPSVRFMANGKFTPAWKPGGQPVRRR